MERDKEYDEFGPWVHEVENADDVPAIFSDFYNYNSYNMLFKIPRKIERRNARPGMDLYDCLVGACETYIHILKRNGKRVNEIKIDYESIVAIKDIHSILDGELILFTRNEPAVIEYNTVSEEIIIKFIGIVKEKICGSIRNIDTESISVEYRPEGGSLDMHLYNLINRFSLVNQNIRLAAYQPDISIEYTLELRRTLKVTGLKLKNVAFIINEKELIILERETIRRRKDIDGHSYSFLYLPYDKIIGTGLYGLSYEQGLMCIEPCVYNQKFPYIFENSNYKVHELYQKLRDINN